MSHLVVRCLVNAAFVFLSDYLFVDMDGFMARRKTTKREPEIDPEILRVCKRIQRERKSASITQAELAKRSGISLDAVHRIEAGQRSPNLSTLFSIARSLGVSPAQLLDESESPQRLSPEIKRLIHFLEQQPPGFATMLGRFSGEMAKFFKGKQLKMLFDD